ncbi:hypothetical protein SAMD00019534_076970 [Acytostelium subglobosum LB1]|uniref:hypothetical protein n=1 Tax=Acytostelium subglobosum LB1 TaxID=1410327 RepID=UPI00064509F4|nr:hypothetical protein SAMD00019534_076970 [Acytostelium subglobosum LB1]GAM24522.1 hypothetical protein SAMD00019534_076970 [Acytostelium subglobosum LB1]|eukprot:XP_012752848.1 hypothetical protein SAMD00019534_076970 [Acytostelium subglobosum LB1]
MLTNSRNLCRIGNDYQSSPKMSMMTVNTLYDHQQRFNYATMNTSSSTSTSPKDSTKDVLDQSMDTFLPQAKRMIEFIDQSPSPYHAVSVLAQKLISCGFVQLSERTKWSLEPGKRYLFIRNQSCISAFIVGKKFVGGNPFAIAAAHTDSPTLRVRPVSKVDSAGYLQVGCEMYGGGLWYTWFDRDLSVAGRVMVRTAPDRFESKLVHIKRPLLRIPSLAIHLDRSVNTDGFKYNTQNHVVPILANQIVGKLAANSGNSGNSGHGGNGGNGGNTGNGSHGGNGGDGSKVQDKPSTGLESKHHPILLDLLAKELNCSVGDIQNFDLCVCDTQPAAIGGASSEFIHSPRLDNLNMSYCVMEALSNVDDAHLANEESVLAAVLFDNEEVGSSSPQGACAPLLIDTITRINRCFARAGDQDDAVTQLTDMSTRKSFLISADMAHAVHPNYAQQHEPKHRPLMNRGTVIKYNSNLRYATDSTSAFIILELARRNNIPIQEFLVRNDVACGSTIGPIISGSYGIKTVDIGNAQLSMHSIRETSGVADVTHSTNLIQTFYEQYTQLHRQVVIDDQQVD